MSLDVVWRERRLIRYEWERTDEDGREYLCWLTAIAGRGVRPETCPASIAPEWVAHLLQWMDDSGSQSLWDEHVERLIPISTRLHELGRRAMARTMLTILGHARRHGDAALARVVALWARVYGGDEPAESDWFAAADDALGEATATNHTSAETMAAETALAATHAAIQTDEKRGRALELAAINAVETVCEAISSSADEPTSDAIISDILTVWAQELGG